MVLRQAMSLQNLQCIICSAELINEIQGTNPKFAKDQQHELIYLHVIGINFWVALFGTEVVAGSALFGTSKNLVAEPSLFGTVRKNILVA